MRQVVLDTETTGLEVGAKHRVIEIGCIEIVNRRVTAKTFHRYLNPDREIDRGAFDVHGISRERLANEPRYADIDAEFIEFIHGAELLIHNAPFDVAFLNAEFSLLPSCKRQIADICTVLDTLALAKRMHPGQRNNLDALCKRYSIDNSHRDFHGALLDARILSDVYLAMTGGQVTLVLGAELDSDLSRSRRAPTAGENAGKRAVVRWADEAELAAHEHVLDGLDKASAGKTLWRQAGAEAARA